MRMDFGSGSGRKGGAGWGLEKVTIWSGNTCSSSFPVDFDGVLFCLYILLLPFACLVRG